MIQATLTQTTWDMRAGTVDAVVEYVVQGRKHMIPIQVKIEEIVEQAVKAGRTAATWERVDVATLCETHMGLPVGIADPV